MKAGLFAASAVALAQLAVAQPGSHGHAHRHLHEREVAEVTTTVILPEVVVYVDEAGKTLGAETKAPASTPAASTPTPASSPVATPTPASSSSQVPTVAPVEAFVSPTTSASPSPSPSTTSTPPPPSTSAAPSTSSAPAAKSSSSSSGSSSGNGGYAALASVKGATYSPYQPSGDCKDSSTVSSDIASLASQGFGAIRLYGVDCSQISNAVPAARKAGLNIIAGVFNIGSVTSDLSSMASQLNNDFSGISAITIYNEPINNGQADASTVASAIGEAKGFLKSTNFAGGVAGVDTFNQLLESSNSAVIEASDFVAANCHSWFDTTCSPGSAANFVHNSCIEPLTAIAGGKPVVITESGWPCYSPRGVFGANLASLSAQSQAMGQLKGISGLFAFSPFSTKWHKAPDTVEDYWGIGDCS